MKSSNDEILLTMRKRVFENNLLLKEILSKLNSREHMVETKVPTPALTIIRPAESQEQLRTLCQIEDLVSSYFYI